MATYDENDRREALEVVAKHVRREQRSDTHVTVSCGICRTWWEDGLGFLRPKWPCEAVIAANRVIAATNPKPATPPPVMPSSMPSRWQQNPRVNRLREARPMAIELDVEPDKSHRGVVNVSVTDSSDDLYETVDLSADDARLLGLRLIHAADTSERPRW
jgi:hypothetical protein